MYILVLQVKTSDVSFNQPAQRNTLKKKKRGGRGCRRGRGQASSIDYRSTRSKRLTYFMADSAATDGGATRTPSSV